MKLINFKQREEFDDSDISSDIAHFASNLPTYWAYMMVTSDVHPDSGLPSLGMFAFDEVIDIVQLAAKNYVHPYVNFEQYALATVYAAEDIYGKCSAEVFETIAVWEAVGISMERDCIDIDGGTYYCEEWLPEPNGTDVLFQLCIDNYSPNSSYTWFVEGTGWIINNQQQYEDYTGDCLFVYDLNDPFTSYPKNFTFKVVESPSGIDEWITVTIDDCDNSEPDPCDNISVYFKNDALGNSEAEFEPKNTKIEFINNSSSKYLNLVSLGAEVESIVLVNLQGQVLLSKFDLNDYGCNLDYSSVRIPGVYYVIVRLDNGIAEHTTLYID